MPSSGGGAACSGNARSRAANRHTSTTGATAFNLDISSELYGGRVTSHERSPLSTSLFTFHFELLPFHVPCPGAGESVGRVEQPRNPARGLARPAVWAGTGRLCRPAGH